MKKWASVLFAWWFLSFGQYGGYSGTAVLVPVGPFRNQEECEKVAQWARDRGYQDEKSGPNASWCWWDGK